MPATMSGVHRPDRESPGERLVNIKPGLVALPLSKSLGLRGLLIGSALRREVALISTSASAWELLGDDLLAGISCAKSLGSEVSISGEFLGLKPADEPPGGVLAVGESGFVGRVAPACAALSRSGNWLVEALGTLARRGSPALWTALADAGVALQRRPTWVSELSAVSGVGQVEIQDPRSSQEVSALVIALAAAGGGSLLVKGDIPSRPYLEMTLATLEGFGVEISWSGSTCVVSGPAAETSVRLSVEVDASAAAVALAAGCLANVQVEVPAPHTHSLQGDWRIVEHLRAFGCQVELSRGRLIACGPPSSSANLDLSAEPDLAPVLAVVAAAASMSGSGPSLLSGLGTLDAKESPRGRVLASGLIEAGFECVWSGDSLEISGQPSASGPVVLDSYDDHRMAFAFALLGVILPNVWVSKGDCIAKSWPGFWSSMGE